MYVLYMFFLLKGTILSSKVITFLIYLTLKGMYKTEHVKNRS